MPNNQDPLWDLRSVQPEEAIRRRALGLPGGLRIEVGSTTDRFGSSRGRPMEGKRAALVRAVGAVTYPADREQLREAAASRLSGWPELGALLAALPDGVYGGELEVLDQLRRIESDLDSSAGGSQTGGW